MTKLILLDSLLPEVTAGANIRVVFLIMNGIKIDITKISYCSLFSICDPTCSILEVYNFNLNPILGFAFLMEP